MIKFTFATALVCMFVLIIFAPVTAYASEPGGSNPITITVIVPRPEGGSPTTAGQQPALNHVYPVHVWESRENGRREIIRVYELREDESSSQIRRESFERDGFRFELAEIVRREIPSHSVRDHTEVIELSTQTSDLETVIRLLTQTIEYMSEDGYFGVLSLDISTIQIASQGTTSSSFTATRTREFPHLSSTDTSLVPRTITDNGRTYNLATVEWQTQGTTPIDHREVATTFTAVATYSRVGTRVSTIGYTTIAEYSGQISRVAVGRTEFTAHFIGIPIVSPAANPPTAMPEPNPEPTEAPPNIINIEQVQVGGIVIATEPPLYETDVTNDDVTGNDVTGDEIPGESAVMENGKADDAEDDESGGFPFGNILLALLFIGGMVLAYFAGKKGKEMWNSMKKASCLLLICGLAFGLTKSVVHAAELPRYGFGVRNGETAVHFNERPLPERNAASPLTTVARPSGTSQQNTGDAIHLDPRRSDVTARASPNLNFQSGNMNAAPNSNINALGYSYGDVIGSLTVERLGRTVRVIAGATMEAMDFGAGHFSFTGLNYGNTGLIGHNRGRTNGFFDFVRNLREGDILTLDAGGIVRRYEVAMLYTVDDSDFSPLMQFSDHRLTLVTCVEYQRTRRRVAVAFALD